jgi:DNA-binding Xre family transcriptional regulator
MITLDLSRLMETKGIQNPLQFLIQAGFTYHTAGRLIRNQIIKLDYKHLEKLCLIFNCTPNDLLSWTPPASLKGSDKLALSKLAGRKRKGSLVSKLIQLPEDKIDQLNQMLDKLASE